MEVDNRRRRSIRAPVALQELRRLLAGVRSSAVGWELQGIEQAGGQVRDETFESSVLVVYVLGRAIATRRSAHLRDAKLLAQARHSNRMGK